MIDLTQYHTGLTVVGVETDNNFLTFSKITGQYHGFVYITIQAHTEDWVINRDLAGVIINGTRLSAEVVPAQTQRSECPTTYQVWRTHNDALAREHYPPYLNEQREERTLP